MDRVDDRVVAGNIRTSSDSELLAGIKVQSVIAAEVGVGSGLNESGLGATGLRKYSLNAAIIDSISGNLSSGRFAKARRQISSSLGSIPATRSEGLSG